MKTRQIKVGQKHSCHEKPARLPPTSEVTEFPHHDQYVTSIIELNHLQMLIPQLGKGKEI